MNGGGRLHFTSGIRQAFGVMGITVDAIKSTKMVLHGTKGCTSDTGVAHSTNFYKDSEQDVYLIRGVFPNFSGTDINGKVVNTFEVRFIGAEVGSQELYEASGNTGSLCYG